MDFAANHPWFNCVDSQSKGTRGWRGYRTFAVDVHETETEEGGKKGAWGQSAGSRGAEDWGKTRLCPKPAAPWE